MLTMTDPAKMARGHLPGWRWAPLIEALIDQDLEPLVEYDDYDQRVINVWVRVSVSERVVLQVSGAAVPREPRWIGEGDYWTVVYQHRCGRATAVDFLPSDVDLEDLAEVVSLMASTRGCHPAAQPYGRSVR